MRFSKLVQCAMERPGTQRLGQRDKLMPQYPGVQEISDGKFRIRVKVRIAKTGRQKELKKVLAAASYAEAAKARQKLREQFEAGATTPSRVRLADYVSSWLRGKLPDLQPSTRDKYALVLGRHVLPMLGDCYVDGIERDDIVAWRDAQQGKPSTINSRLRVLRTVFADATVDLSLARNPCARIRAARESRRKRDPNRLTAEQFPRVLAALQERAPERYALYLMLAFTAARIGEASALKWGDIDFAAGTILIQRARWKKHIGPTKTGNEREVPMDDALAMVLKAHRRRLIERQAPGLEADWVFPSASGWPIYASTLRTPLKRALAAAGVTQRFTLHGFRRTFNNLARQAASSLVVRSITGHGSDRMFEHYSHVEADEKRRAAHEVVRLVYPPRMQGGLDGGIPATEPNKKTS